MHKQAKQGVEILIHILIWSSIFFLLMKYAQNIGAFKKADDSIYIPLVYGLISNTIIFYLNALVFIPAFLPQKKIKKYVIQVLVLFIGITLLESLLDQYVFKNLYSTDKEPFQGQIILNFIINALILSLSIGYGFIKYWIINESQKQKLIKQKLHAELNYLKAQVNPHFLFNTLNMAYASALKHGDENTSEIIEKLSGLMRYNLYESNEDKVDLEKELNYLKNYIDLQLKRLSNEIRQKVHVKIDDCEVNAKIAPLLLLPFIENVFKHGIILSKPNKVVIEIKIDENRLKLFTKNSISGNKGESEFGGIGVKNVKERLYLLYKGDYSLNITNEKNYYITELSIKL